jgi:hypothetical protein
MLFNEQNNSVLLNAHSNPINHLNPQNPSSDILSFIDKEKEAESGYGEFV